MIDVSNVPESQSKLFMGSKMNLGRRIQLHLAELRWKRSNLFGKTPALLPSALSLTITGNNKRSKLDAEMAKALGGASHGWIQGALPS